MENRTLSYADTINLDANQFVKDGYIFIGWNTNDPEAITPSAGAVTLARA